MAWRLRLRLVGGTGWGGGLVRGQGMRVGRVGRGGNSLGGREGRKPKVVVRVQSEALVVHVP
jgi:hypothetical protein